MKKCKACKEEAIHEDDEFCIFCGCGFINTPLTTQKDPVADVPCNVGLDARYKTIIIESFSEGYRVGEADAIDGATKDARERAEQWFDQEIKPKL
jgi:hypothetical protein